MKKSSATSSQSSRPEEKRLSEYLQYNLFEDPSPYTSKRVTITKDKHTISVSNPALQKVIWDLVERDSAATVDREHNHILANIVAYKKDNPALPKVIELRIPEEILETQQVMNDGRPNYKAEVKEAIFESEKEVILGALTERLNSAMQRYELDLSNYQKLDETSEVLHKEKEALIKSRGFYRAENVSIDPITLIATKTIQGSDPRILEESVLDIQRLGIDKDSFSDGKALKDEVIKRINAGVGVIDAKLDDIKVGNPEYARWTNGEREILERQTEFLSKAISSGIKSLSKEKQDLSLIPGLGIDEAAIAKADPNLLDNAIREARGRSEDYLHFLMKNDPGFMTDIKAQLPEGADRIYLVITSTLDACKRCAWKVEEMVDLINQTLFSEEKAKKRKFAKLCTSQQNR